MPTMLYKCPGPHDIHGGKFDYLIVDDDAIEPAKADGWHLTTTEAKQAAEQKPDDPADDSKPPTREEMEQMADKLGIEYSARVSDKKLRALVDAAAKQAGG